MAASFLLVSLIPTYRAQVLASCAHGTHLFPRSETGETVEVKNFGYSGEIGPLNWAALDAANGLCATGTQQSPIDMTQGTFTEIPGSMLNLQLANTEGNQFENIGTTVEVVAEGGGSITVGQTQFELQQFHFHLPSEHLDEGVSQAMEMHMVFESANQSIAVVGTYINISDRPADAGAFPSNGNSTAKPSDRRSMNRRLVPRNTTEEQNVPSPLLETVLASVSDISQPGNSTTTGPLALSDVASVLSSGNFQNYQGSLTTPPCSEGVTWFVSTQQLSVTPSTFAAARDVIGFNARFPQNFPGQPNALEFAQSSGGQQAVPGADMHR